MFVIRKNLSASEILPPNRRFNTTTNTIQYSPDGTTWVDDPASDPRHSDIFRLPALTGEDAQCNAAARITAAFKETLDLFISSVNLAQFVTLVLNIVLLLLGPVGVLIDLIFAVGAALILIGVSNIVDSFTPEVWARITEIIYCHIGEDGQVSIEQRDAIMAEIAAEFPGTIYNTLVNLVNLFGEVLMSNAGVERSETGDCDEYACSWRYCWLGGAGLGDWITPTTIPGDARSAGVYDSGTDTIQSTSINIFGDEWANFELTDSIEINGINVEFDYVNEESNGGINWWVDGELSAVEEPLPAGTGSTSWVWSGAYNALSNMQFRFAALGHVTITRILIDGRGTPPASGMECE